MPKNKQPFKDWENCEVKRMRNYVEQISKLQSTDRIASLKGKMLNEPRSLSLEQALLITECYKENENLPRILQRAKSLALALNRIGIKIDPDELIVGNRTPGVRSGVVSPENNSEPGLKINST